VFHLKTETDSSLEKLLTGQLLLFIVYIYILIALIYHHKLAGKQDELVGVFLGGCRI
jgi:hypothetical protein